MDDKLAFYRQQFNAVDKKRAEKEVTLRDLVDEKRELLRELQLKEEKLNELTGGNKMLRGEALEKYFAELRRKTLQFKKCKTEQAAIKTEHGILERTKEVFMHLFILIY